MIEQSNEIHKYYEILKQDFDNNELISKSQLQKLVLNNNYKLFLFNYEGIVYGYSFIYENIVNNKKFYWIDYFAILKEYRNKGLGKKFINQLLEYFKKDSFKLFLEIEIPNKDNINYENQIRRINFYSNFNIDILPIRYYCPNNNSGLEMYLAYKSFVSEIFDYNEFFTIIKTVFNNVYSDVKNINSFLEKICLIEV